MSKRIWIAVAILVVLIPWIPADAQEPTNPYIYYYSDALNAFIIERADGTDARLLAEGVMPENHNAIDSVDWSPSGTYMAWRSHSFSGGPSAYSIKGWLIRTDGTEISTLLDDAPDIFLMEWAPDQDWLLIGFNGPAPRFDEYIWLLDVPNNRMVHQIQVSSRYHEPRPHDSTPPHSWSPDGTALFYSPSRQLIVRLNLDGTMQQWFFETDDVVVDSSAVRPLIAEKIWDDGGSMANWMMTDLITQETRLYAIFPEDDTPQVPYKLIWNQDRTFALVSERRCTDDHCLRDQIALFDWEHGTRYLLPDSVQQLTDNPFIETDYIWSPDGRAIMLMDNEIDRNLFILDTVTRDIVPIDMEIGNWQWVNEHDVWIFTMKHDDGKHSAVHRFDWQTRTYTELENISPNVHHHAHITFSPDSTFAGYRSMDVCVQNLINGETYVFPRHSRASYGGPVTRYKWHEDNQWFFAGSNTQFMDWCCDSRAISLHHLGDAVGREVTLCYGVETCTGFVPDRALPFLEPGQSTSLTPQPKNILLHGGMVTGLAWHPGGDLLASYSNIGEGGQVNLWNMTTDEPTLINTWDIGMACGSGLSNCPMQWRDNDTIISLGEVHNSGSTDWYRLTINIHSQTAQQTAINVSERWYVQSANPRYALEFTDPRTGYLIDTYTRTRLSENSLQNFYSNDYFIDFDPASNLLVGSGVLRRGGLWDVSTGEQVASLNWTGFAAAFRPGDPTQLAVAGSSFISLWDMTSYR